MFKGKTSRLIKIFNFKTRNSYLYTVLILLLSFTTLNWFHGEQYISAGDSTWPFNFKLFFERSRYVWDDINAPGFIRAANLANLFPIGTYGYFLELIGVSSSLFQHIVYVISFFFSGFGIFLLLNKLRVKNLGAFSASIFYMLSPYALIAAWNPGYGRIYPFYSFLPLGLFLFLNYVDSEGYINTTLSSSLCLTALSLLSASFNNIIYFVLFIFSIIFIALVFRLLIPNLTLLIVVKKTAIYLLLYTLLNSYWIVPSAVNLKFEYTNADNVPSGLIEDYKTRELNSVSLVDALRMEGLWTMTADDKGDHYYTFYKYWSTPQHIFLSFIPLSICILLVLREKNIGYAFTLGFFLFIVYLCSGLKWQFGLGKVVNYFYFGYLGRALRVVYLKLGIFLVIPLTILIGFSIQKLEKWKNYISILILVISVVSGFAFFTGDIIKPLGDKLPGCAVSIPQDYLTLASYLNNNNKFDRVLVLPIARSYNYLFYSDDFHHAGVYFLQYLSSDYFLYRGSLPYVNEIIVSLNNNDYSLIDMDYILVHKGIPEEDMKGDTNRYLIGSGVNIVENIKKNIELKTVMDTNNYTLYKVSKSISDGGVYIQKVSPVLYEVNVINTNNPIVLNQSFNSGWVIKNKNVIKNDLPYNKYWNSWYSTLPGKYQIYFEPQRSATLGIVISLVCFSILVCHILLCLKFKCSKYMRKHINETNI